MANVWHDVVHLDRMMIIATGSYAAGPNETTFALLATDNTLDTLVLGPVFTTNFGKIVTVKTNTAGSFVVDGNYSAGEVVIGRQFTMSIQLTRPYVRDRENNADFDARLTIRETTAALHVTGQCKIRLTQAGRPERLETIDADPIPLRNVIKARYVGEADQLGVYLENDSPKPCIVTAVEWVVDYAPRWG